MKSERGGSTITTLFEGDYALGLGALANSLYANGFRGRIVAGYRGALAGWACPAGQTDSPSILQPAEGLEIELIPIPPGWHLANLKPHFMLDAWDRHEADAVFYFDPDIVVKCRWSFFEEWAGFGVGLCEEAVMANMPEDHPLRLQWLAWAAGRGLSKVREVRGALNSGFIGVPRSERAFIEQYRSLLDSLEDEVPLDRFAPGDRSQPFHMTDQDALNVMGSIYVGRISRIGPEGMDFVGGGFTMSHAAGAEKPWRKGFIRSALRGVPPTLADKGWLAHCSGPIQVLNPREIQRKRKEMKIASTIGRLVRRA
ncbi:MAG TPA: hypothetical protein VGE01_04235 [Fimbriimonas sp.]